MTAKRVVIFVRVVSAIDLEVNYISGKFHSSYKIRGEFFSEMSDMNIYCFESFSGSIIISPEFFIESIS